MNLSRTVFRYAAIIDGFPPGTSDSTKAGILLQNCYSPNITLPLLPIDGAINTAIASVSGPGPYRALAPHAEAYLDKDLVALAMGAAIIRNMSTVATIMYRMFGTLGGRLQKVLIEVGDSTRLLGCYNNTFTCQEQNETRTLDMLKCIIGSGQVSILVTFITHIYPEMPTVVTQDERKEIFALVLELFPSAIFVAQFLMWWDAQGTIRDMLSSMYFPSRNAAIWWIKTGGRTDAFFTVRGHDADIMGLGFQEIDRNGGGGEKITFA